jgi:predicted anti-sigma-YlaC factor YlaD
MRVIRLVLLAVSFCLLLAGCSIQRFAINKIGDAIASGGSTYESDDDIQLVTEALPFSLKLVESLLAESPKHQGLLITAAQGFTSYGYLSVQPELDVAAEEDFEKANQLRGRARRLYLRGYAYAERAMDAAYKGMPQRLSAEPLSAVKEFRKKDIPLLYWSAAALGSAISVSKDDVSLLARLPEVEALLSRAIELDESWKDGALHEFQVVFSGAKPGTRDYDALRKNFDRALQLSKGGSASLYVAYAEAFAIPKQDREQFESLLNKALEIDPDQFRDMRLINLVAQRRARWLLARVDDLIIESEEDKQ